MLTAFSRVKNGDFWFCTEHGLSRYNPILGKFKNYRIEDGLLYLPFRVVEDDKGNCWVSTSRGLSMLNLPKTDKFSNYTEANGLPSEQFNYNSSARVQMAPLFLVQ